MEYTFREILVNNLREELSHNKEVAIQDDDGKWTALYRSLIMHRQLILDSLDKEMIYNE